jgi:hypothetical protein
VHDARRTHACAAARFQDAAFDLWERAQRQPLRPVKTDDTATQTNLWTEAILREVEAQRGSESLTEDQLFQKVINTKTIAMIASPKCPMAARDSASRSFGSGSRGTRREKAERNSIPQE